MEGEETNTEAVEAEPPTSAVTKREVSWSRRKALNKHPETIIGHSQERTFKL
jgi:hypothetical protein